MEKNIRNSDIAALKHHREMLTYTEDGLVPCETVENEESVTFLFHTQGLEPVTIKQMPKEDRLRFLVNCAALESLSHTYDISLDPDNIMTDINLYPKILTRDIKTEEDNWLPRYKALAGAVINAKSRYSDYLGGGKDLYRKNAVLSEISKLENTQAVRAKLTEEYHKAAEKTRKTKTLIDRNEIAVSRTVIPVLAALIIGAAFLLYKNMVQTVPYQDRVIDAYENYVAGDYLGVTDALAGLPLSKLSVSGKYILARSYVISEGLTDSQRENILGSLALNTDPIVLDYWIYLGSLDFRGATDIAGRLGDDDLLLFAYMKQEIIVKNDTNMGGEEKTALINELDGKIKALTDKRTDTNE